MELNNKILHNSIVDGSKVASFKTHFPNLSGVVNEILAQPKCGICARKLMTGVTETTNFKEKLELVFETPVTGKIIINNQTSSKEVKRMSEEEWVTFYKKNNLPMQGAFIYFNSVTGEVVVSYNTTINNPVTIEIV